MKKNKIKIFFLGSGNIAIAPLAALHASDKIDLVGIGTQMDRPAGRKHKLQPTPVGIWVAEHNIDIVKPQSVNSAEFLASMRELNPDIIFVASFGQLLKNELLALPRIACMNLHASLLPAYRGASPIISALLDGVAVTGITFMKMDEGLDTGPVYCSFEYKIRNERADQLENELGRLAAQHIEEVIEKVICGTLQPCEQSNENASYAAKIKKEDGIIDWLESAENISWKVRAFYPWPGVFFHLQTAKKTIRITITDAEPVEIASGALPGVTVKADKNSWIIACGKGGLLLKTIKPEGKGEMSGAAFVRGHQHLTNKILTLY